MSSNHPVFFDESGKRQKIVDFVLLVLIFLVAIGVIYTGYYLRKINAIESEAQVTQNHPQNNTVTVLYSESNDNAYSVLGDKVQKIDNILLPRYRYGEQGITTPLPYSRLETSLRSQSSNINTDYDTYYILSSRDYVIQPSERVMLNSTKGLIYKVIDENTINDITSNVANADVSGLYVEVDISQLNNQETIKQFDTWLTKFKTSLNSQGLHLGLIVDPASITDSNKSSLNQAEMVYFGQSSGTVDAQIEGLTKIKEAGYQNIKVELPTASIKTDRRPLSRSTINVEYNSVAPLLVGKQFNDRTHRELLINEEAYTYGVYDAISAYNYMQIVTRIFGAEMRDNFAIADPGFEEYTLWDILECGLEKDRVIELLSSGMVTGLAISREGYGQIYSIENSGKPGTRNIIYDSKGTITGSKVEENNSDSQVAQHGVQEKK